MAFHSYNNPNQPINQSPIGKTSHLKKYLAIGIGILTISASIATIWPLVSDHFSTEYELQLKQYNNLKKANNSVNYLVAQWSMIEDINAQKKQQEYIFDNFDNVYSTYNNAPVDKLPKLTRMVQKSHLAKLHNIKADMLMSESKTHALKELFQAISLLDEVSNELDLSKAQQFSSKEKDYIKSVKFKERIDRTRMVSYALILYSEPNSSDEKHESQKLLKKFGDCEGLMGDYDTKHHRILIGLDCLKRTNK